MGVSHAGEEETEGWVGGYEVVGVIDGGVVDGREALEGVPGMGGGA